MQTLLQTLATDWAGFSGGITRKGFVRAWRRTAGRSLTRRSWVSLYSCQIAYSTRFGRSVEEGGSLGRRVVG